MYVFMGKLLGLSEVRPHFRKMVWSSATEYVNLRRAAV